MFIHLEMRKTMSQEPFDFSSTAESDFAPSHAYVSKKTKIEDVTSTAYTFTIVSVAGFILLILFGLDLLPFLRYLFASQAAARTVTRQCRQWKIKKTGLCKGNLFLILWLEISLEYSFFLFDRRSIPLIWVFIQC